MPCMFFAFGLKKNALCSPCCTSPGKYRALPNINLSALDFVYILLQKACPPRGIKPQAAPSRLVHNRYRLFRSTAYISLLPKKSGHQFQRLILEALYEIFSPKGSNEQCPQQMQAIKKSWLPQPQRMKLGHLSWRRRARAVDSVGMPPKRCTRWQANPSLIISWKHSLPFVRIPYLLFHKAAVPPSERIWPLGTMYVLLYRFGKSVWPMPC